MVFRVPPLLDQMREGVLTSSVTGLVRATLANETDSFEFITSDILHIGCRTKHLNVIDKVQLYFFRLSFFLFLSLSFLSA
jgi:hypothetical protein